MNYKWKHCTIGIFVNGLQTVLKNHSSPRNIYWCPNEQRQIRCVNRHLISLLYVLARAAYTEMRFLLKTIINRRLMQPYMAKYCIDRLFLSDNMWRRSRELVTVHMLSVLTRPLHRTMDKKTTNPIIYQADHFVQRFMYCAEVNDLNGVFFVENNFNHFETRQCIKNNLTGCYTMLCCHIYGKITISHSYSANMLYKVGNSLCSIGNIRHQDNSSSERKLFHFSIFNGKLKQMKENGTVVLAHFSISSLRISSTPSEPIDYLVA